MTWRELEKAISQLPESVLDLPASAQVLTQPSETDRTLYVTSLETPQGEPPFLQLNWVGTATASSVDARPKPRAAQPAARR